MTLNVPYRPPLKIAFTLRELNEKVMPVAYRGPPIILLAVSTIAMTDPPQEYAVPPPIPFIHIVETIYTPEDGIVYIVDNVDVIETVELETKLINGIVDELIVNPNLPSRSNPARCRENFWQSPDTVGKWPHS